MRNRFQLVDFKNPENRFPAMKLEQRIFIKKTQKTPRHEIELALKRAKEVVI